MILLKSIHVVYCNLLKVKNTTLVFPIPTKILSVEIFFYKPPAIVLVGHNLSVGHSKFNIHSSTLLVNKHICLIDLKCRKIKIDHF
jgi:hypothetical protein